MATRPVRVWAALAAVVVMVSVAYANHWSNPFHFDDTHTIVQNPAIRDLANLPRLLSDARAASVYPTHAVFRPVTYVTLAVDYALAGGLDPRVFHASTFLAFLILLGAIVVLAWRTLEILEPDSSNAWFAVAAAALFGVHPACADTVNYIIQRAEVWSSLGTTASVALYAARPQWRKYGLFLIPGVLGIFAKTTPASIFPLLIALYALVVERYPRRERGGGIVAAVGASAAAVALCGRVTYATQTFDPGAPPFSQYLWTQPWVMLRYVRNFVVPLDLSIDPGWSPLASPTEPRALAGYVGLAVLLGVCAWCLRRRSTTAVGFGLAWFLIALVPVSVFPLAEVTNDHRMFLPFVGLCLAVAGAGRAMIGNGLAGRPAVLGAAAVVVLGIGTVGTRHRNQVWSSHEAVWADAVRKNPAHGRGRMNLGVALMARGAMPEALTEFEEAVRLSPGYGLAYVNLAIVQDALGRRQEAERNFQVAMQLSPDSTVALSYYGRWLLGQGRNTEAVSYLERAVSLGPDDVEARRLLMNGLRNNRAFGRLRAIAAEALVRLPGDPEAEAALKQADVGLRELASARAAVQLTPTADGWLDLSLRLYNEGDFPGSLDAAERALALRPDSPEAYNNIAAAHSALGQWALAIDAARRALALRPDFPLARNNLAWALSQQARTAPR